MSQLARKPFCSDDLWAFVPGLQVLFVLKSSGFQKGFQGKEALSSRAKVGWL